jgi:hypothetical protein
LHHHAEIGKCAPRDALGIRLLGQAFRRGGGFASTPATVLQNPNASNPNCQYYQQLNVQEQNGYEVFN